MPYAVVQDVPASWEQYAPLAAALGDPGPEGLILHVAGPTEEGFRTIDVWETREAWERFGQRARVQANGPWAAPTLRVLATLSTIRGLVPGASTT